MNTASTFGEAVLRIAPADIFIPRRLGLYFPDKAAALGKLIAVHGQRTPITVRKPITKEEKASGLAWVLIAGRHRLGGVMLEELPHVIALERVGSTAADALDEEASENLDRRDQPPLERAIFIHATCEAAKARLGDVSQHKLAAKARWDRVRSGQMLVQKALSDDADDASGTMQLAYGWVDSVAEAFGRDKSSIHRALKLYRMIIEPYPGLVQELSDHPVVGNNAAQLKAIAEIKDEAQRLAVIKQLLADTELSAEEASVRVGIGMADQSAAPRRELEKYQSQIKGGWGRLSLGEKRNFIPDLAAMMNTPELKRALRDKLNEELGDA